MLVGPLVEIVEKGERVLVRWDVSGAKPDGIAYDPRSESLHVCVTQAGRRRLTQALGRIGASVVVNMETVGVAEIGEEIAEQAILAVRRALLQPGSLAAEVHSRRA